MDCIVCGVTKSQTRLSDFHCLSILLDQWRLVTESEDRASDSRPGGFLVGVLDWSRSQSKGLCEGWTLELCRAGPRQPALRARLHLALLLWAVPCCSGLCQWPRDPSDNCSEVRTSCLSPPVTPNARPATPAPRPAFLLIPWASGNKGSPLL